MTVLFWLYEAAEGSMLGLMLRDCCLVILIIGAGHAHARACVGETKDNLWCWLLPSTLFVFK